MKYITYTAEWIAELLLILLHFPMYLLNTFVPLKSENKHPTQNRTIILVERWFRHNVFHAFGKWYLEKKGFKVYTMNYSLAHGTFDDAAKKLEKFIDEKKLSHVVLVGISAGALSCMQYLQKRNGWEKTDFFISVGGPLKGASLAKIFPINASVQDMNPTSSYLAELYEDNVVNVQNIYCLYATADNMVGRNYSTLPGTYKIHIDMVGHNLMHTFWLPTYKRIAQIASK